MTARNSITEGPIVKALLSFFFPILLGTFFQQLYNTVDAVIVGQVVGSAALGAVGGSSAVIANFLVNLFVGLSSGATVVIAQYYGSRQIDHLRQTVHTAMLLAVAGGAILTVIALFAAVPALHLLKTPEDIMGDSAVYLQVYFCGVIPSFLYNMGSSILRAVGDSRRPLYFLIAACVMNIVLDLLFVVVLGLGVLGVAIATVLSQVFSAALVLVALTRKGALYCLDRAELRFRGDKVKAILRLGVPAALQSNMYTISNMVLQACINGFGTLAVSSWTAFSKVDSFYWMVLGAFGVSITTFVSQNFGARQYDRLKQGVKICLGITFAATAAISVFYFLCSPWLLRAFTSEADVIDLGRHILVRTCPFYVCFVCIEVFSGAIRGTGDALKSMLLTCGGVCVFRVLWVLLVLPHFYHLDTVIYSYPVSWTVTSLLYLIYYLRGNWLRRGIARQEAAAEEV